MTIPDEFSKYYKDYFESTYDCVDRIILNGYFPMGQSSGGFRTWWSSLMDGDENLDNTHLIRFAGRFSRRVRAYAKKENIPLIDCRRGDKKHEIAEKYIPKDPNFKGVFCILVGRAPTPAFDIKRFKNRAMNIRKKTPLPYLSHYSFHIVDPEWGHMTIKLCPHPPFNAQIMLNGHEYAAIQAKKRQIIFTKEGNCFTTVNDATDLAGIADSMRAPGSVGRLVNVCERWIYSACLCFGLNIDEQKKSGFYYSYSVYQVEYSRNLLFKRGHTMDKLFQGVIDRTRSLLNIKSVKTIFGYKHRPFKQSGKGKSPRFEVVVERPVYDLTIFKVHFGKLTVKMYSKGERVLRTEVIAHNTKDLRCGKLIGRFPTIIESLKDILERFLSTLSGVDISFIDDAKMETWHHPSMVGTTRVGGIDVNQDRTKAVMKAMIALSVSPRGFSASNLAEKVREILKISEIDYHSRQSSYDLKKFRGKNLVYRKDRSHFYETTREGLKTMTSFIVLHDKVIMPLLSNSGKRKNGRKPQNRREVDVHYQNIQIEMQKVFQHIGIAV